MESTSISDVRRMCQRGAFRAYVQGGKVFLEDTATGQVVPLNGESGHAKAEREPAAHRQEQRGSRVERMFGKRDTWQAPTNPDADQGPYKGFLMVQCEECGAIKAFCAKHETYGYKCGECGHETPLEKLRPLFMHCKCGKSFSYKTNLTADRLTHTCLACKAPVDLELNSRKIKAAGYATDPGYPQKLIGLIEKYGLTVYDGKAEQEDKTSMNISITKKTSTHNTTAAAGRAIRYIVVHYTAGVTSKPGSAAGTASYFGSTPKWVSADFIVDDGGAVQYNGDIRNRYTWHCGGGKYNTKGGAYYGKATNRNTIGIEVCSTNNTGKMTVANDSHWSFTDKVVSNLVELVKYLMAEYGIDAAHVIRHYDVTGKPCPGIIGWNEDTGSAAKWAAFKARLGAATPGGQIGGSTNTGTATGNTALTYKVGDIVQFAGGKHYANAQATSGTTVKPGPAKVTAASTPTTLYIRTAPAPCMAWWTRRPLPAKQALPRRSRPTP